jgi:hypothetical protein
MKATAMKKHSDVPERNRYTPKPVPENSCATCVSPESPTGGRLKVMRWHSYHGTPWIFWTEAEDGPVGELFSYEPNAIAYCQELERELAETNDIHAAVAEISLRRAIERMNNG